jgi:hypothetical protein
VNSVLDWYIHTPLILIFYQDEQSQEHGVVEEDGVGSGLIFSNLK